MNNHTPTPTPWGNEGRSIFAASDRLNEVAQIRGYDDAHPDRLIEKSFDEDAANAAHIVKCVNAHDELVAALDGIVKLGPEYCAERPSSSDFDAAYEKARAVLEKVGGQNG